jgi:hypothetical protein
MATSASAAQADVGAAALLAQMLGTKGWSVPITDGVALSILTEGAAVDVGTAIAQDIPRDMSNLARDSFTAQGGMQRPQVMHLSGTLVRAEQPEQQLSFDLVVTGSSSYKTVISGENFEFVYVRTEKGAQAVENGREVEVSPLTLATERCPFVPVFGTLQDLTIARMAATLTERSSERIGVFEIGPQIPLKSSFADRAKSRLEIDLETKLPVAFESTSFHPHNPSHTASHEYRYGDYKRVGPILIPHRIEVLVNGSLQSTITVTSADFEVPVPAELSEVVSQ